MKTLTILLMLVFGVLQTAAAELKWYTGETFSAARRAAETGNKFILIDFTGSDW